MGNYVSCTLSTNGSRQYSKVILPNNEVRDIGGDARIAAAELMLEFPGLFLVDSRSLRIGNHFNALSADEELEAGHVYVMFPMQRLNSVVDAAAADMAPLLLAARGRLVGRQRSSQVAPVAVPMLSEETPIERRRSNLGRSRRPVLETIEEESFVNLLTVD